VPDPQPRSTASGPGRRADDVAAEAPALVPRAALLDRLLRSDEPVITVVAPPGYGKTTLLTAWAERQRTRLAWLSCDEIHDDPVTLWTTVAAALRPTPDPGAPLFWEDGDGVADRLTRAVGAGPAIIVLDRLEALPSRECRRSIAGFADTLPAGWRLVVASRAEAPIRVARMRVEHRLLEVGTDDLAMSRDEASLLLAAAGVDQSAAPLDRLVHETEGWPAGLYLAALAILAGDAPDGEFTGDDRLMSDYLRSEVLDRLTRAQRTFLVRTSILERLSGPLCDAVVDGGTSSRLLDQLRQQNVLVPLDRRGEWYRYHRLLRQLLQAELRVDSPDLVPELHRRAAAWFEDAGELEDAIDQAYLAGDTQRFGRLVLDVMQQVWASGRIDTVEHWMRRLGGRTPEPHTPAMVAHGALIFALLGRPGDTERWAAVAESLPTTGTLPDGSTVEATMAYLRANLCREGPAMMREDAAAALSGLGPASPYRATMLHTVGLSYLLEGDLERADASFAHAFDLATSIETSPVAALVLTEQFLVAAERNEWSAAESLIKRSLEIVGRGPYDEYWTSALVFAAAARGAAHRGEMPEAREYARRAARLRPLLTYALPVVSVQALVELARAYLALVDPSGARAVLEQTRSILQQRPELGELAATVQRLEDRVGQITAARPLGASSLTAAELRLVPLLPTHLTYPEIGERLFISRHTVKTHAGSVYRKLGASSRAEAVERIVELGLV
jgi:LuxR family maltose regulon positive regulatory protein